MPVAFYLYLPVAAAYATFGRPIVEAVLGSSLNPQSIDLLWDCSRIFLLMNLSLAILAPASAILSPCRYRAFVVSAASIVLLDAVGVIIASSSGPVAVAAVHASLAAALAIPLLGIGFGSDSAAPAVAAPCVAAAAVLGRAPGCAARAHAAGTGARRRPGRGPAPRHT